MRLAGPLCTNETRARWSLAACTLKALQWCRLLRRHPATTFGAVVSSRPSWISRAFSSTRRSISGHVQARARVHPPWPKMRQSHQSVSVRLRTLWLKRSSPGASWCEPSDASPPPALGRLARTKPCSTRWATVPSAAPTTPPLSTARPIETTSSPPKRCSCHLYCQTTVRWGPYAPITNTTSPHRPKMLTILKQLLSNAEWLLSSQMTIGSLMPSHPCLHPLVRMQPLLCAIKHPNCKSEREG